MSDHIEVTGRGSVDVTPDCAVVRARVQCIAERLGAAFDAVATRTEAAVQAASDHGVAEGDRRTEDLGVHANYDDSGQRVVSYAAYQSIRLVVRDVGRVAATLQALIGAAGDHLGIESVSLEVADATTARQHARKVAFADARAIAEGYAALASSSLGPVLFVHEGADTGDGPRPLAYAAKAAVASMPVESGSQAVKASVRVRWALR